MDTQLYDSIMDGKVICWTYTERSNEDRGGVTLEFGLPLVNGVGGKEIQSIEAPGVCNTLSIGPSNENMAQFDLPSLAKPKITSKYVKPNVWVRGMINEARVGPNIWIRNPSEHNQHNRVGASGKDTNNLASSTGEQGALSVGTSTKRLSPNVELYQNATFPLTQNSSLIENTVISPPGSDTDADLPEAPLAPNNEEGRREV